MDDNIVNSWTETMEKLAKKWRREAIAERWKHEAAGKLYYALFVILSVISLIISAITGTGLFFSNAMESSNRYIAFVAGSVIILLTIINALKDFFNFGTESERHKATGDRYNTFSSGIEAEFALPRAERVDGKLFIRHIQKRFSELMEISPDIPQFIDDKYDAAVRNNEVEDLFEIIIDETTQSFNKYIERSDREPEESELQQEFEKELGNINLKADIQRPVSDTRHNRLANNF